MTERDPVAAFARLLETAPADGGGVELLLAGMAPERARLVRLCAIPHELDRDILRALAPELDATAADAACAELSRLAVMVGSGERLAMHDRARTHLFRRWLEPSNRDDLARASAALAERLASRLAESEDPTAREELLDRSMFHRLGADPHRGFAELERLFDEARHGFRLSRCDGLLRLAEEYRPILEPAQIYWLEYQAGKIAADRRDLDRAQALLEPLLDRADLPAPLRIKVLKRIGHVLGQRGDHPAAIARYAQALALANAPELAGARCDLLHDLATAHRDADIPDRAEQILRQAVELAADVGDASCLAACHNALGSLYLRLGNEAAAIAAYERCLVELDRLGQHFRTAQVLNNLGTACLRQGRLEEGERHLLRSLKIKREAGDGLGQANTLSNLVEVYRRQERRDEAFTSCLESIGLFLAAHANREAGIAYRNLGQLYWDNGQIDSARDAYREAMRRLSECGADDEAEAARRALASLEGRSGIPWWMWAAPLALILLLAAVLVTVALVLPGTQSEPEHFATSPDMRRWARGIRAGGAWMLEIDGERLGPFDALLPGTPLFSEDGRRLVYGVRRGDRWTLTLDGEKVAEHERLVPNGLAFSPDGRRFAYAGCDGGDCQVFANGEPGPRVDEVFGGTVLFSPDSQRLTYRARIGQERHLYIDHQAGPAFEGISLQSGIFSTDGRRIAYHGLRGGQAQMVLDGIPGPGFDEIWVPPTVYSPDGQRTGYLARRGDRFFAVIDGQTGPEYDDIAWGPSLFSPDSRRVAYLGKRDKHWHLNADGEERGTYEGFFGDSLLFSPDSSRTVLNVGRKGRQRIVVDGVEGPVWDGTLQGTPVISPDSQRIAYAGLRIGLWSMIVDGHRQGPFLDIRLGRTLFSPDSRHIAYAASDGQRWFVVLDGIRSAGFAWVGPIAFDGSERVRFLVITPDGQMQAHRIDIPAIEGETTDIGTSIDGTPKSHPGGPDG